MVSNDSTDKSCQAGDIELVEPGHSAKATVWPFATVSYFPELDF